MSTKINLGTEAYDFSSGMLTENHPLKNFKTNLLISGGSRSERTELLSHVLNQFYATLPDIGVLLIQLGSNKDTYLYQLDKVFEYGTPELNIPYYAGHWFNMLSRERFKHSLLFRLELISVSFFLLTNPRSYNRRMLNSILVLLNVVKVRNSLKNTCFPL